MRSVVPEKQARCGYGEEERGSTSQTRKERRKRSDVDMEMCSRDGLARAGDGCTSAHNGETQQQRTENTEMIGADQAYSPSVHAVHGTSRCSRVDGEGNDIVRNEGDGDGEILHEMVQEMFLPYVRMSPGWTLRERVKTSILTVTLFPVRLAILVVGVAVLFAASALGTASLRNLDETYSHTPFPRWRRVILSIVPALARALLLICFGVFHINRTTKEYAPLHSNGAVVGTKDEFEVSEQAHVRDGKGRKNRKSQTRKAEVIVSNHLGYIDIAVLLSTYGASFVAKEEIGEHCILGRIARGMHCLFLSKQHGLTETLSTRVRKTYSSHRESSADECDGCGECLNSLVIFPEGTTCNGFAMVRFRTGVFHSGLPVRPIAIRFRNSNFNLSWESILFKEHMWRAMTQLYNTVDIVEYPLYYPSENEQQDALLYSNHIQQLLAKELAVPVYELNRNHKMVYHSYLLGLVSAKDALANAKRCTEEDGLLNRTTQSASS